MKIAGLALVVAAYAVALPVIFRLKKVYGELRTRSFLVLEGATVGLVVGYLLAGRTAPAAVNAVAALVMAGAWWGLVRRSRISSP